MSTHRRMWINQPSTLHRDHPQHGRFVITDESYPGNSDKLVMCLFPTGLAESGFVSRCSLSPGWPEVYRDQQSRYWDDGTN